MPKTTDRFSKVKVLLEVRELRHKVNATFDMTLNQLKAVSRPRGFAGSP